MQDFFALNLSALADTSPKLAKRLQAIVPNTHYEVFLGDDVLNFNIIDTRDCTPIFVDSPIAQTNQKIVEFMPYAQYPYLYCFGLGNGVFYKVLLQNAFLKRVVVIEPELEILFVVLHLLDFSKEITESKIVFLDSQSTFQDVLLLFLHDKHTNIYSKLYNLHIFNAYYERYAALSIEFNRYFIKALEHCVISVGNDSKDAITGIAHHIANLPKMLRSPSLIALIRELRAKRAHKGDTAIIVATGPSLSKQLPLLKQYQDYLTIFCIDASLPILAREGIKPDVVFSLERVDLTARFYEETPKEARKDVIFAITTIVHKRLWRALQGDCVQWSMRPFGYTYYFGFSEYGYIGVGMSAANMAYEMVVYARFSRCILIGQDLAFAKDGSSHAKNAVYGEREITPKQDSQRVLLPAYGGEGVVESTSVWKLFLEFYEADIAQTPYPLEVINATEGGARIQGSIEMPFIKALEGIEMRGKKQPLALTPPPLEMIESNIAKAREKTREFLAYAREKKARIEEVFLEVAGLIEDLEAHKSDLENFDFSKVSSALEHIESIKEFFADETFTTCFNDAIQSYIVHQEMEIAKIIVRVAQDEIALKAKQIDLLYAHKYWLFSLAGGIDCVIEVAQKSFSEWECESLAVP